MLPLDPSQVVRVLLVAVIDGLMARALRINVHDGIDQTCGSETRSEGDVAKCRLCAGQIQICSGDTRTNDVKILAAANLAHMEAVNEIIADLPIQSARETIAPDVGSAGSDGTASEEADLSSI